MRRVTLLVVVVFAASLSMAADEYAHSKIDRLNGLPAPPIQQDLKAGADDCVAPPAIAALPFVDTGDTTGGTSVVNSVPLACSPWGPALGPDHIWEVTLGAAGSLTVTATTSSDDYDIAVWLLSTCNDGTTCVAGADNCYAVNAGGNPCDPTSDETFGPVAPGAGTYYLFVDSYYSSASGLGTGPYNLDVQGVLPVELIGFAVE